MKLRFLCTLALLAVFAPREGGAQQAPATPPSNLIQEGIPEIPESLKLDTARYHSFGGTEFHGWNSTARAIVATNRVGGLRQLLLVSEPNGKRHTLTNFSEPVSSCGFQPRTGKLIVVSSDKGGNERYQLYALPVGDKNAAPVLLTDGQS